MLTRIIYLAAFVVGASILTTNSDPVCKYCPEIDALLKRMDRVEPDPLNGETIDVQVKLWGEASDILQSALANKDWSTRFRSCNC